MPRDMPSTTREFAQLAESMEHELKMSIGTARLTSNAATIRREQIDREASAVAASETAKVTARGMTHGDDGARDDFVWPVLGTTLPSHRRQNVKHWRETHGQIEPMV